MHSSRLWARSARLIIALLLLAACLPPAAGSAATAESIAKVLSFTSANAQPNGKASIGGSGTATIISGIKPTQQGSVFTKNPITLADPLLQPDTTSYQAAPAIISVAVPANGSYTVTQTLEFIVGFSEPVTVDTAAGTPALGLVIGAAARQAYYVSGSGTSALAFRYTVQSGESDTDGISVSSLSLNGGTVRNNDGIDASFTLAGLGIPSTTNVLVIPKYTLHYDGNGNTGGSVTSDVYSYASGETVTVLNNDGGLVKAGFTFAGWNDRADGTGKDYAPETTFAIGSANLTLYAKWTANAATTYTVSFDTQGGSTVASLTGISPGDMITAPLDPTKAGYTFGGWYKEAGTTTPWDFSADTVTEDITLYAKWVGPIVVGNDASLASLSLTGAALNPAFHSGVTTYTANVNSDVDHVVITAAASDPHATIVVNGLPLSSGSQSQPIALRIGGNAVDIIVTAANGMATRTYSVEVQRASAVIVDPGSPSTVTTTANPPSSSTETVQASLESDSGNLNLTLSFTRTTDASGKKKDAFVLTAQQAERIRAALAGTNNSELKLVLPDGRDEVSEWAVTLQKDAAALLANMGISVEIITGKGSVHLSKDASASLTGDVTLRIVPAKPESERSKVQHLIENEPAVLERIGDASIVAVGIPVVIETNAASLKAEITLPLNDPGITADDAKNLAVFVKHGDGTVEMLRGQVVVYDKSGKLGLRFAIDRFSTFAIVRSEALNIKQHAAYITGYEDGTFRPNAGITRAEMAALLSRAFEDRGANASTAVRFSDVAADGWAVDAIACVSANGWMIGEASGRFLPHKTITRAEMATIAARFIGQSAAGEAAFPDTKGHWAEAAIAKAQTAGIMKGYESGKFLPDSPLTRAEAVVMLNKLLGREPSAVAAAKWNDVAEGYWAYGAIQAASSDEEEDVLAVR